MASTRWTGPSLRAERVKRSLRAEDVARAIGLSRRRVSAIETSAAPSERDVERYLDAVRRIESLEAGMSPGEAALVDRELALHDDELQDLVRP
jgi:transcriptional regulator with XRE-family HTH domain